MKNFLNYIVNRLKERSTWLGLIGMLGAVGISLSPENSEAIITVGVAVASALAVLTGDKNVG